MSPANPDLKILEGAVFTSRLPVSLWSENMLFHGAKDLWLRQMTGCFPAGLHKNSNTHPVFLLSAISNIGFKFCPCSSKFNTGKYIVRGCILDMTGRKTDKTSYILEKYSFNLPVNPQNRPDIRFLGKVPEQCLKKNQ